MAKAKQYVLPRKYTQLGEYLAEMRIGAELTQREVSQALGYSSAQFISNFERGIAVPPLKKLAELVIMYKLDRQHVRNLILAAHEAKINEAIFPKRK